MIKTGCPHIYHLSAVCVNPRHNYLTRYTMGGRSCSINALHVTITTTTSFRGNTTFCQYKCPQGRYGNYMSIFKSFHKWYYFSSNRSLWRNCVGRKREGRFQSEGSGQPRWAAKRDSEKQKRLVPSSRWTGYVKWGGVLSETHNRKWNLISELGYYWNQKWSF